MFRLISLLFVIVTTLIPGFLFHKQPTQDRYTSSESTSVNYKNILKRILIPKINVDANIESVGINSNGEMESPSNIHAVSWYEKGYYPGENGSAVMAGHLNGPLGEKGVFADLKLLAIGDKIYIIDEKNKITEFTIKRFSTYNPGYAEEVFSLQDRAHLNLVTCDGSWDKSKNNYSNRLVVFSEKSKNN